LIAPKRFTGNQGRVQFGYNATEDKGRRQAPKVKTASGDYDLKPRNRSKLVATARDQVQNLPVPAWMVRRHVSYVSHFNFHAATDNPELNTALSRRMAKAMGKDEFDIAGRHSMRSAMAVNDTGKIVDGESFIVAIKGGYSQLLESDRIAKPDDLPKQWAKRVDDYGLVKDKYGRVTHYCRCRYEESQGTKLVFDGMIKRSDMLSDSGFYTRPSQTRGITPLSTALNTFRDLAEGWEYTLLKIKAAALFGVAITRDVETDGFATTQYEDDDVDDDGLKSGEASNVMDIKNGLMAFDLDPGDKVEAIESKTPHGETIPYSGMIIRAALLACDIPYTAYDATGTSFSAVMADRAEYEKSVAVKREDNQEFLRTWTTWKLDQFEDEDTSLAKLIRASGYSAQEIAELCEWVPDGTPWMDQGKEVAADGASIALGINSRQRVCKRRGIDFNTIAKELAEEESILRELDITYIVGAPGTMPPVDPNEEPPPNE
jgi:capsid protein